MQQSYLTAIHLIERLHRQFLEVIKSELERLQVDDINNIQALILFNIGKDTMTVGELTHRGYYLGSNVSYNVKKMTEHGYIVQQQSPHDKRSIRVKLSDKGLKLWDSINDMFAKHSEALSTSEVDLEDLKECNQVFHKLESFWSDVLNRAGVSPFSGF